MPFLVVAVAWCVLALSLATTASLVLRFCPGFVWAGAQLMAPWTTLVVLALAVTAAVFGDRGLAGAAALVAAVSFTVIWPKTRTLSHPRHPDGPAVRVAFANLYTANADAVAAADQLLEQRPDLLVMTELTPELVAVFDDRSGGDYAHRVHRTPIEGEYAVGIFSAHPFVTSSVSAVGELWCVEARVACGPTTLHVIAVHPVAPASRSEFRRWRAQLASLRRRMDTTTGAVVVVGDLNACALHVPFERLLVRSRFRDAHEEHGHALTPSWGALPSMPRWVPPIIGRLDHLLVTREVEVRRLRDLDPVGSDHRPFVADLRLGPATSTNLARLIAELFNRAARRSAAGLRPGTTQERCVAPES